MKKSKTPAATPPVELDHRLYILMRNDLPSMNPGKAMAQAAHASNQFVAEYGDTPEYMEWIGVNPHIQSRRWFGTTIVVAVNKMDLEMALMEARGHKIPSGEVYDPTYPYIVNDEIRQLIDKSTITAPTIYKDDKAVMFRNELTCGYIFLVHDTAFKFIVSDLPLHP